jgi:hypothetical protein
VGGFCEKTYRDGRLSPDPPPAPCRTFAIIKKPVRTSARKYLTNGIYKTQGIFFLIFFMYQLGYPQQTLVRTYRKLIRQDKI